VILDHFRRIVSPPPTTRERLGDRTAQLAQLLAAGDRPPSTVHVAVEHGEGGS